MIKTRKIKNIPKASGNFNVIIKNVYKGLYTWHSKAFTSEIWCARINCTLLTLYGMAYFWPLFGMGGMKTSPLSKIWTRACLIIKLCTHLIQLIRSLKHSCFVLWRHYFFWRHQFCQSGISSIFKGKKAKIFLWKYITS